MRHPRVRTRSRAFFGAHRLTADSSVPVLCCVGRGDRAAAGDGLEICHSLCQEVILRSTEYFPVGSTNPVSFAESLPL